jgi:hypothetical protein
VGWRRGGGRQTSQSPTLDFFKRNSELKKKGSMLNINNRNLKFLTNKNNNNGVIVR